jgi:hypothetical protein
MGTPNLLIDKIEQQRKDLIELASRSTFSTPEVIKASVTLDKMLNQYELYNVKKQ